MLTELKKYRFADCEFDLGRFELRRAGEKVDASTKTLDLLLLLIENEGTLVTRDELFDALWPGTVVNEGSLSNAIYELRGAVGDDAQRQAIVQTVRGRGFRFVAELEAGPDMTPSVDAQPSRSPRRRGNVSPLRITSTILLLGLSPQGLLAYVNWLYNSTHSIPDSMRSAFDVLVGFYNPITFSVGALWIFLLTRRPIRALRRQEVAVATLEDRQRTLLLGHTAALVGVALWIAAGILYPTLLHLMTGSVDARGTLQFLASLVLCGLAAVAYPFFLITRYAIRVIYPALVFGSEEASADQATLLRLGRLAGGYLVAAGGIPLFTVILLSLSGSGERWLLALVGALGLVGLGAAFLMYRSLLEDLTRSVRDSKIASNKARSAIPDSAT
ncbi:winged helix-turn-helix domain-containing protein [Myxococcota bacterium]|nr:winged helix-turn-helix domain-containing protein [Myxococcota bacterium]